MLFYGTIVTLRVRSVCIACSDNGISIVSFGDNSPSGPVLIPFFRKSRNFNNKGDAFTFLFEICWPYFFLTSGIPGIILRIDTGMNQKTIRNT
jgi:hypothetical protein